MIRRLLGRLGYQARVTRVSGDGIEVEAVNPQPIAGGTLVVQCKTDSQAVDAPAVHHLLEAVRGAGASKGVLLTTSHFSPDAWQAAEGEPLELIEGAQFESLLRALDLQP